MTSRVRATVIVYKYEFTDMWTHTEGSPGGHTYIDDIQNKAYHVSKDVTGRNKDEVMKKVNKWAAAVADYFKGDRDYARTELYLHFNDKEHSMNTIDTAEAPAIPEGF